MLLTSAFEEVKVKKPLVRADIPTPTKLTKDGNPAAIVKADSWYDAHKTQFFAVDKVIELMGQSTPQKKMGNGSQQRKLLPLMQRHIISLCLLPHWLETKWVDKV